MKRMDSEQQREKFLTLLKRNIAQCLYLAIDLETYGLNDPNVAFYYDEARGEPETLIMNYYDSVQLFSADAAWNAADYAGFIGSLSPVAVCAKRDIIEKLEPFFPDYFSEYGVVIADNKYTEFKQFGMVRRAQPEDAQRIAELMFSTEEFRQNNTLDTLAKQLSDRMSSGKGRSFIIEENGVIAAHSAIYAECGGAAVESGLVVHEDFKRKFYGLIIHEFIKKQLTLENKTLYGLRYNESMRNSAKMEKLDIRAECGRLIKKR